MIMMIMRMNHKYDDEMIMIQRMNHENDDGMMMNPLWRQSKYSIEPSIDSTTTLLSSL
jgi:radical SAM superfamily enzyme